MDQGDTESMMSGEGGSPAPHTPDARSGMISPELHRPGMEERLDSLMPGDSASHHGHDIDEHSAFIGAIEDTPFTFKFKAPNGRVHRLAVTASAGLQDLINVVADKLGSELDAVGGVPTFEEGKMGHAGFALSYMDNEGDTVSITTDHDLFEAISLARSGRRDKVDLFVHDPSKAAIPPTTERQPLATPPTPPESQLKQRRRVEDDEEESPAAERRKERKSASSQEPKQQDQVVPGVPNELLLPGALVVLGAVVIITFAVGRASSSR